MKRLFTFLALVLGLVSCQTEPEGFDVNVGGEQDVNITVSLPESTRAASNQGFDLSTLSTSDYELRYILEIYLKGGDDSKHFREVKYSDATTVSFPVRLAPSREYHFAVWADLVKKDANRAEDADADYYYETSDGLKNITIDVNKWTPNVEARDAFYGKAALTKGQSIANLPTIELTRPFAKVRVVATDIEDIRKFGIEPTNAVADYFTAEMYTSFNAVEGKAFGTTTTKTHTFNYADVDTYTDVTGQLTVFADYVFVPEDGNVQFSLDIKAGTDRIKLNSFNTAIPVEANKVTSIVGDVLTEGGNVNITIDGTLEELETITLVDTAASLQEVIAGIEDGGNANIELGGDIDLGDLFGAGILSTRAGATLPIVIAEGKTLVLDLNGFKITTPWEDEAAQKHYYAFENHGSLTIQDSKGNGQIIARGIFNYGTMTLKSGTINACDGNGGYGVRNYEGAEFVMNGGSIVTSYEDGDTPGNGYDASPVRVDEGATATINGGVINNVSNYTVAIDNYGTTTINDGTFTTIHTTIANSATMTINGGSFTCDGLEGVTAHAFWAAAGTATINGGTFNGKDNYNGFNVDASKGAVVNINGGKFLPVHSGSLYGDGAINVMGGEFFDKIADKYIDDDYTVEAENGLWKVVRKPDVAKIDEVGYTSLAKAVAAVNDGGTITLVADEVFTEKNYYDNGGWKDGLGYSGDKSFTIDLNNKTIRQDGALNDYLIWIKNDGSKANTITLKNGTLDAGTTAFCAFATASSNKQKITINFENVNLVGNNSNGAVAKIRGGAELNVKSGTVITGKNNYVGIEAVGNNTVVNIYDNVNIYQNGTGSYVGGIVGASYNATMNIYGGYGKSAKCGIIVMSTGATINVSGGEWIANNDGTVAADNNAVLVSQNNRYETGWACKSILNVTGGTFKGGYNCYGMGPGVEPDDAQINIKGGNFNANPANYVVAGYESVEKNGVYTVGKPKALADFEAAIAQGGNVTLSADITLLEPVVIESGKTVVLNLNGKTLTATNYAIENYGTLTINGNGTINGVVYGENGTTTVENGTFNPADGGKYVFLNSQGGTLTINGGTINGGSSYPIYSYDANSSLVINNVTVNATFGCVNAYGTDGSVEINGGTFQMTGVQGKTSHIAYFSNVDATINGGTFKKIGDINMSSTGGGGICVIYGANLTINGGDFAGDYDDVYDWGGTNANGRKNSITINGGTFKFE